MMVFIFLMGKILGIVFASNREYLNRTRGEIPNFSFDRVAIQYSILICTGMT